MRSWLPCLLLMAAACGGGTAPAGSRPDVVAGAYPFAWAAEQVAGPDARVTNLVAGAGEPHDVELAPRQVGAVEQADVVVYLRGFQPAVDDAITSTGAQALDLRGPGRAQPPTADGIEGSASGIDPHVWLDPQRMQDVVRAIRDRLVRVDPANRDGYTERAETAVRALGELDQSFAEQLEDCERRQLVTEHTAFAYLAERYDLEQVGLAGVDAEAEPTPGRIAEVIRLAERLGVTTIYQADQGEQGLARTVAREIGATTAVLDPLEGVVAGDDYLSVMRRNADALRKGLDCR